MPGVAVRSATLRGAARPRPMTVSQQRTAGPVVPKARPARAGVRAQRLAWSVIAGAFAVWCALVALSVISVRAYIVTAATPQSSGLAIQRGVVFYQDALSQVQT